MTASDAGVTISSTVVMLRSVGIGPSEYGSVILLRVVTTVR